MIKLNSYVPFHMHRLSPGTKYYYQYGSTDGPGGFSEEHMFVAPPIPGSNVTTKILAFGGEYSYNNYVGKRVKSKWHDTCRHC